MSQPRTQKVEEILVWLLKSTDKPRLTLHVRFVLYKTICCDIPKLSSRYVTSAAGSIVNHPILSYSESCGKFLPAVVNYKTEDLSQSPISVICGKLMSFIKNFKHRIVPEKFICGAVRVIGPSIIGPDWEVFLDCGYPDGEKWFVDLWEPTLQLFWRTSGQPLGAGSSAIEWTDAIFCTSPRELFKGWGVAPTGAHPDLTRILSWSSVGNVKAICSTVPSASIRPTGALEEDKNRKYSCDLCFKFKNVSQCYPSISFQSMFETSVVSCTAITLDTWYGVDKATLCDIMEKRRIPLRPSAWEMASAAAQQRAFSGDIYNSISDTGFKVIAGEKEFHVDKRHFACVSEVFAACLSQPDFKKTTANEYRIADYSAKSVDQLLIFCFQKIAPELEENVIELVALGHQYHVQYLVDTCEVVLIRDAMRCETATQLVPVAAIAEEFKLQLLLVALHMTLDEYLQNGEKPKE